MSFESHGSTLKIASAYLNTYIGAPFLLLSLWFLLLSVAYSQSLPRHSDTPPSTHEEGIFLAGWEATTKEISGLILSAKCISN